MVNGHLKSLKDRSVYSIYAQFTSPCVATLAWMLSTWHSLQVHCCMHVHWALWSSLHSFAIFRLSSCNKKSLCNLGISVCSRTKRNLINVDLSNKGFDFPFSLFGILFGLKPIWEHVSQLNLTSNWIAVFINVFNFSVCCKIIWSLDVEFNYVSNFCISFCAINLKT